MYCFWQRNLSKEYEFFFAEFEQNQKFIVDLRPTHQHFPHLSASVYTIYYKGNYNDSKKSFLSHDYSKKEKKMKSRGLE